MQWSPMRYLGTFHKLLHGHLLLRANAESKGAWEPELELELELG